MPDFTIETSGFNRFRDRLDTAIIQLSAQKLYNAIKEKVPEIEMERSSIIFLSVGKELVLSSANLSSQLRHKLHDSGFSFALSLSRHFLTKTKAIKHPYPGTSPSYN